MDDAGWLCVDRAMCQVAGERAKGKSWRRLDEGEEVVTVPIYAICAGVTGKIVVRKEDSA